MEQPQPTKFAVWLKENRYTDPLFAREMAKELKLEKFSHRTIEKWRLGLAIPRPASIKAIKAITGGAITMETFVEDYRGASGGSGGSGSGDGGVSG